MIKSIRKGSASYITLMILEKAVDGFVAFEEFAYHPMWEDRNFKKSEFSQALKRLREGGFISEERVDEKLLFKLTDSGKFLIDEPEEKWDGRWRIVIFDIPEQRRVIRNLLRRNLKKWGFTHLQKSVWINKRNFYGKLEEYIKDLGIERWVTIIEADKISSES